MFSNYDSKFWLFQFLNFERNSSFHMADLSEQFISLVNSIIEQFDFLTDKNIPIIRFVYISIVALYAFFGFISYYHYQKHRNYKPLPDLSQSLSSQPKVFIPCHLQPQIVIKRTPDVSTL